MATDLGAHLSIGEVLALLQDEFPDVTISKIRFLESQGLIEPERTPSGYRRFYEHDIDRLRWVLRQQRDHFLPLKVIKAKLDSGRLDDDDSDGLRGTQTELFDGPPDDVAETEPRGAVDEPAPAGDATPDDPEADGGRAEPEDAPSKDPAAWLAALQESPVPTRGAAPGKGPGASRPVEPLIDPDEELSGQHYTLEELAGQAGLSVEVATALCNFGLLTTSTFGGQRSFDHGALEVARAAAAFVGRGIEARHLRAYKLAAEREAGLFEQLALPLLRQRNPDARRQAADLVSEMSDHGERLRRALLRQALRAHVAPR